MSARAGLDGRGGRGSRGRDPRYVGLVVPSLQGGVFLNSAPLASYRDTDDASVRRYLSAQLLAGHGAHGVFMKTWAAGLAYSNGFRASPRAGLLSYYAERTPELPQTLKFVIEQVKGAAKRPALSDYALAQAFGASRVAASYEARAESMAEDVTDGAGPDVVRRFRQALLAARSKPGFLDEVFTLMPQVYGRVLPGYGPPAELGGDADANAVFFVIGAEGQLDRYAEYLASKGGEGARLVRLYPRDFWIPAKLDAETEPRWQELGR